MRHAWHRSLSYRLGGSNALKVQLIPGLGWFLSGAPQTLEPNDSFNCVKLILLKLYKIWKKIAMKAMEIVGKQERKRAMVSCHKEKGVSDL